MILYRMNRYSLGLLCCLLTLGACKKYDEGPTFSLRTKEERISNTWRFGLAFRNGKNITDLYSKYELQLLKGGETKLIMHYTSLNFNRSHETRGRWDLTNSKRDLKLDFEDDNADNTYIIKKLKEKELWLIDEDENVEFHLIPM